MEIRIGINTVNFKKIQECYISVQAYNSAPDLRSTNLSWKEDSYQFYNLMQRKIEKVCMIFKSSLWE